MEQDPIQYQIQVQKGAGNGEVIIIYNSEHEVITPELLANTLTELSKQAANQQDTISVQSENVQSHEYVLSQNLGDPSRQYELSLIDLPTDQHHGIGIEGLVYNGVSYPDTNAFFIQNPIEDSKDHLIELPISIEGIDANSLSEHSEYMIQEDPLEVEDDFQVGCDELNDKSELDYILAGEVSSEIPQIIVSGFKQEVDEVIVDLPKIIEINKDLYVNLDNHCEKSKVEPNTELEILKKQQDVYDCKLCDYSDELEINVQRHLKSYHDIESPFKCSFCGKVFQVELTLQIHQLTHGVKSVYDCTLCGYSNESETSVQRHLKSDHNVELPFKCSNCGKRFQGELSLKIHQLMHGNENKEVDFSKLKKKRTCPLCDFEYRTRWVIKAHFKRNHKDDIEKMHKCKRCPYICLSKEELQSHIISPYHDEELKLTCPKCGISCKHLKRHMQISHTNLRPFLCDQCGFAAKSMTNLKAHLVIHREIKPFKCLLCDYTCFLQNQLDRHMIKHSSLRSFECPISNCSYRCKTTNSLKRHSLIHSSRDSTVCQLCSFRARDRADLKQHKSSEHPRNKSYECKDCNIVFKKVIELKKHSLAVHRSSKICFCAYCDFSCETAQELRDHMQLHYGTFSFNCEICGYTCRLKSLYKRHMARHNKVKQFACSQCSYACAEKADLQKHLVSKHSDETPFACPHCSYKCKFKTRLESHVSYVHSDVKPYFCKYCSYSGKSAENLRKHVSTHTGITSFATAIRCVLCDYSTGERAKLKRHMQVHVKNAVLHLDTDKGC